MVRSLVQPRKGLWVVRMALTIATYNLDQKKSAFTSSSSLDASLQETKTISGVQEEGKLIFEEGLVLLALHVGLDLIHQALCRKH